MRVLRKEPASSEASRFRPWLGRSAERRRADHWLLFREASARLARTRRPVRSSRGRPYAGGLHGIQRVFDGKWLVIKVQDNDFVRHTTSPSRRGTTASRHSKSIQMRSGDAWSSINELNQSSSYAIRSARSVLTPLTCFTSLPSVNSASYFSYSTQPGRERPPEKLRDKPPLLILL